MAETAVVVDTVLIDNMEKRSVNVIVEVPASVHVYLNRWEKINLVCRPGGFGGILKVVLELFT